MHIFITVIALLLIIGIAWEIKHAVEYPESTDTSEEDRILRKQIDDFYHSSDALDLDIMHKGVA